MPPFVHTPSMSNHAHGATAVFYWYNPHGNGLPPHHARAALRWRVLVSRNQGGWEIYEGAPINNPQLYDPNVNNLPCDNSELWTVAQWQQSGDAPNYWRDGTWTKFVSEP